MSTDTREERVKQTGLIGYYVPFKMFLTLWAFMGFIAYMREDLTVRFMAHPSLNALIIGTMVVAISMAFINIFKIQTAANLLKRLEKYEENPDEETGMEILRKIRTRGHIINTFYMEGAILALKKPGSLVFNDNQSRIMKSKVGQRTTRLRHSVQYLAGVLVMLGLIGTFWGLLETITSVGAAMSSIVSSFADSNGGGGGQDNSMVEFLQAISKPLQGMGIAFSASLFGLSGSLIAGLLNSFCSKGINSFLEDFSNWIDTRIPAREKKRDPKLEGLNPVELIEHHNRMIVEALEDALGGMAKQQHQMFHMFSGLIKELTEFGTQQASLVRTLSTEKRETMRIAASFEDAVGTLNRNMGQIREYLAQVPATAQEMREDVRSLGSSMREDVRGLSDSIMNTQQTLLSQQRIANEHLKDAAQQNRDICNNLNTLFDGTHSMKILHSHIIEVIETLHDDTMHQKDKMIELVMVMQHILQTQIDPSLEIESTTLLQPGKDE